MPTFPLASLAPTIDANGITAPPYSDILASKQASYRLIYGADVDLASDTQDGQSLAIEASAVDDMNMRIVDVYNAFSPQFAQGVGLSSVVKINGLRRQTSSFSTADLVLIGQAGTIIPSGICADLFGNQWTLPPNVLIPDSGDIIVTGTCVVPGAIAAQPGTITQIVTIIPGWQNVTNPSAATLGAPVETDAALRQRQAISTSLPAQTPLEAILANVANIAGVTRYAIYENDRPSPDANGIPRNAIAVVIEGGDVIDIATIIAEKKAPGTGTFGDTTEVIIDPSGVPVMIDFFRLAKVSVYFTVTIKKLTGYVSTTGDLLVKAVAQSIDALSIGTKVYHNRLWAPANLSGDAAISASGGLSQPQLDRLSATYNITALTVGVTPAPETIGDVPIAFNQAASCPAGNGTLAVA